MLLAWLACTCASPTQVGLPRGSWALTGSGGSGWLEVGPEGCRAALFGESWDTGGLTGCTDLGDGWLSLQLRSGAGEGEVTGLFDGERLLIELGPREGEFGVSLAATPGVIDEVALAEALAVSEALIAADREAWEEGWFRIQVGDLLVGELEMASDRELWLTLYDPSWMTQGAVRARVYEEGAELVLLFPVMPSLQGDEGVIRLNRPLKLMVVPVAAKPDPDDRVLGLVPGRVGDEEREARRAWALEEGGRKETETLLPLLQALAESCEMSPEWELVLTGYRTDLTQDEEGCLVRADPEPVQHGRRLSAEVRASGPVNAQLRPL